MQNQTKRLFIAVNFQNKIKSALKNRQQAIESLFPEELISAGLIRWTKIENLHLTLCFIGYVKIQFIPKIVSVVNNVASQFSPFYLQFKEIQYGPLNILPPRMIWADVERSETLLKITEKIKHQLEAINIQNETMRRLFVAHVTLGRLKSWLWRRIDEEERPKISQELSLRFPVRSIEIMESVLKRKGAEYKILQSASLNQGKEKEI